MAPWQLLLTFYLGTGAFIAILICSALSLTPYMDDANPGDWIVTFLLHTVLWPLTLRRLVKDAILED